MANTQHIMTFAPGMSKSRASKIQRAARAIEPTAYVVRGETQPAYRPGHLSVTVPVSEAVRVRLCGATDVR